MQLYTTPRHVNSLRSSRVSLRQPAHNMQNSRHVCSLMHYVTLPRGLQKELFDYTAIVVFRQSEEGKPRDFFAIRCVRFTENF